jgi:hypothetical protein
MRSPFIIVLPVAFAIMANAQQTAIDLRTQAKDVDFTGSNSTAPFKAGTVIPATCNIAQAFFQTNATPGLNLLLCTAVNSWTVLGGSGSGQGPAGPQGPQGLQGPAGPQGLAGAATLAGDVTGPATATVVGRIQGQAVSATAPTNGETLVWNATSNQWIPQTVAGGGSSGPNGLVVVCSTSPVNNTCVPVLNTAVALTIPVAQSGAATYCPSTNGTTAYTCSLSAVAPLRSYKPGTILTLYVDTTCSSSCTLNVDGLGTVSIKRNDGLTDPGGTLIAKQPLLVFYNGTLFQMM